MTLAPDYITLAQLKAQVRTAVSTDDAALGIAITAASRAIDAACNRQFGQATSPSVRYFTYSGETVDGCPAVRIDDLMTTSGLVFTVDTNNDYSFSTTVTLNTDYDLNPWNAAGDSRPWTAAVFRTTAAVTLPVRARAVAVTAQWGWAAVPSLVQQACLIQAARWFMRRDAWAGTAGSPELGSEIRLLKELDPDVQAGLQPLVRYWGAV